MREQSKFESNYPYKNLGLFLRKIREKRQETLAEVSGAVEIDAGQLSEIENGSTRPSEDILMLLMTYFSLKDDEALKLWSLAGYEDAEDTKHQPKQVMVMPFDARVVYTDMAHIVVNKHGVVMNFMQEAGLNGQPLAVSRIGMSRKHAESVRDLLNKALDQSPKLLPSGSSDNKDNASKKSDDSSVDSDIVQEK